MKLSDEAVEAVLHGGPLAGHAHMLDRDAIDYGQLFVPAPFHRGRYRQAVYCRRLMATHASRDATTWTEWHFRGYVKKRPSSAALAKATK